MGTGPNPEHARAFAAVYNDPEQYPSLHAVAEKLGLRKKTVENYAAILRRASESGIDVPQLISRRPARPAPDNANETPRPAPKDHAEARAKILHGAMQGLFTGSKWPVVNPEALVIKPHLVARYDRVTGDVRHVEGSPRTWLSDTLRVAPISEARNRRFLFTGAQNDAPVHAGFWRNLKAYAQHLGAEIVVGPWTYETNWWDENNAASRVYAPELREHLCFGQLRVGDSFMFCGEMNTLPTATKPIGDLVSYSRGRWAVYPHSKIQLLSVPALDPGDQAFQIMSTGAVTLPLVIPRKAGVKSINQHVIGATIVEFDDDGDIFCRQIIAEEDGAFQDLDCEVRKGRVQTGCRVEELTAADVHAAKTGNEVLASTFGFQVEGEDIRDADAGSMLAVLRPEFVAIHDLHDHERRSHHHRDDVSHNYEMAVRGREDVAGEVRQAVTLLRGLRSRAPRILVIESNHDGALERYVREARYRNDGINYRFGLQLDLAYHDHIFERARAKEEGRPLPEFSLLEWAVRELSPEPLDNVMWVHERVGFILNGVQIGYHGHVGVNGAKGSVAGFARLGRKVTVGHVHSPQIAGGVYAAGVMELDHDYNKGPSGWAVSHVVQYRNGHRTLVTMQKGKWRA